MSLISEAINASISRRKFLKGLGVSLAAAPLLSGLTGCSSAESSPRPAASYRTRLVLLVTMGGVSWWPASTRSSSSSAPVVGNSIYLIDVWQNATYRLAQAFNSDSIVNPDGTYGGANTDGVSVWATLVNHHQVFPAFAFRFYTPDGSVVFSGDTGADILVHEVIDPAWIEYKFGPNPIPPMNSLKTHMQQSHTPIDKVGALARDCNVKTMVNQPYRARHDSHVSSAAGSAELFRETDYRQGPDGDWFRIGVGSYN